MCKTMIGIHARISISSLLFALLSLLHLHAMLQYNALVIDNESKVIKVLNYSGFLQFSNGTEVEGVVTVDIESVNSSTALVIMEVKGVKYVPTFEKLFGKLTRVYEARGNVSFELRFLVNVRTNYAWVNGEFIGFFPFYIFPAIGYNNATKYKFVYLNEILRIDTAPNGEPIPLICDIRIGNKTIRMPTLRFYNDYIDMTFVYHYPISISVKIPLGDGMGLTYFDLSLKGKRLLRYILSIDDYPMQVSYIDWTKLPIVIAIFGGFALLGYSVVVIARRFRKR